MRILIIEPKGNRYQRAGVPLFELIVKQELLKLKNLFDCEIVQICRDHFQGEQGNAPANRKVHHQHEETDTALVLGSE